MNTYKQQYINTDSVGGAPIFIGANGVIGIGSVTSAGTAPKISKKTKNLGS